MQPMEPLIKHNFADGLYAKETHIPAGLKLAKHTHQFTHLSILASGSVRIRAGEEIKTYEAPVCIEIKAGIEHEVQALTDAVWYCIHAVDETDETKIDEVIITKGA